MNKGKFILIFIAILSASGCSSIAPQYQSDFNLINDLKDMSIYPLNSGSFIDGESVNSITLRGGAMNSPYNNSYASYLKNALEEDLKQSGHWDPNSKIIISGELLKNEIDASGFSTGESNISAKFIVSRNDNEIYNKIHSIHHEWESSFIGAIAIPNAQNNYPVSIQKLLREFFLDEDLLNALKRK